MSGENGPNDLDGTGISQLPTTQRENPYDTHAFLGENLFIGICGMIGIIARYIFELCIRCW